MWFTIFLAKIGLYSVVVGVRKIRVITICLSRIVRNIVIRTVSPEGELLKISDRFSLFDEEDIDYVSYKLR